MVHHLSVTPHRPLNKNHACSLTGTIIVHLLVQFWSYFGFLEPNTNLQCGADDGGANLDKRQIHKH